MIFLIENIDEFSEDIARNIYSQISERFVVQAPSQRKESLCAKILLDFALKCEYGVEDYTAVFEKDKKPYIQNNKAYFNISHSGKYVMCCVSESPVGCDIQMIIKYKEGVAKRFFCEEEAKALSNSDNKDENFIKLWTLKESILKKNGTGISGGLSSYDFSQFLNSRHFSCYGSNFEVWKHKDAYISVCGVNSENGFRIANANEIINFYCINERI